MGRTTQTITNFLDSVEGGVFRPFVKSVTLRERAIVARLFSSARRHITAISMTGHLLPFETTLLAMLVEHRRQLEDIEARLKEKLG